MFLPLPQTTFLAFVLALISAVANAQQIGARLNPTADWALINGNIHTMDDNGTIAEAIVVEGDEIVYVGDASGLPQYIGLGTEVIDLDGDMVLPGFVDAHSHTVAGGLIMLGADLQADDPLEIFARIKKTVEESKEEIVFGYGIRFNPWTDGYPTAAMLDDIESERPVYFWAISGHAAWVNSKTLDIAGIDKDTPDTVPGYSFFERDADGNPTGWIVELPAQMQVLSALVDINPDFMEAGVKTWLPRFSAAGITAVQDLGIQGMTQEQGFEMFTEMAEAGGLPLRLQGVYYWNDGAIDPVPPLLELRERFDHPLVRVDKLKINIDGGDDSKNALYVDGYADDPDLDPAPIIPVDIINAVVKRTDAMGIDSVCHCFGDGAVRLMLDAVENAMAENSDRDRRHVISHGLSVHDDDIGRFASLGVIYDSTGAWMSYDPNYQSISNLRLGEERVQQMIPARKIVDAGGIFSMGSDWPVSGYISEYRPLVAIETAITRTLDGRKDVPPLGGAGAGVTVDTAIRATTINAAYNMGRDDEFGSLEVGKKADIVVLGENLYEIDHNNISEVEVLYTIMGGELVYEANRD